MTEMIPGGAMHSAMDGREGWGYFTIDDDHLQYDSLLL